MLYVRFGWTNWSLILFPGAEKEQKQKHLRVSFQLLQNEILLNSDLNTAEHSPLINKDHY